MAWPWPWWKKLTLLLHHFYKPDFLQFSSTRFGCQADTSWDISLWNISVAATLGREEGGGGTQLETVDICTDWHQDKQEAVWRNYLFLLTSLAPAGPSVRVVRQGVESYYGELTSPEAGLTVLSQHCPTWFQNLHSDGTSKDRSAGETIETCCWTYGIIGRQQSQLCRFKYWNLKKPPGVGNLGDSL